jgi:hypothetical protein
MRIRNLYLPWSLLLIKKEVMFQNPILGPTTLKIPQSMWRESSVIGPRVLKPAERNYSPTEREALALKEGLIKFQPFLEGASVTAITDHAALTWSRTFQMLTEDY